MLHGTALCHERYRTIWNAALLWLADKSQSKLLRQIVCFNPEERRADFTFYDDAILYDCSDALYIFSMLPFVSEISDMPSSGGNPLSQINAW